MEITKFYEFDAGHRLAKNYVGKCSSYHGHRYRVGITIYAKGVLDDFDMVMDFGDLKFVKEKIDSVLDHSMILFEDDPLIGHFINQNSRVVTLNRNPTAEVIATLIRDWVTEVVDLNKFDICIDLYETPNSKTTTAFVEYDFDESLKVEWEGFNLG